MTWDNLSSAFGECISDLDRLNLALEFGFRLVISTANPENVVDFKKCSKVIQVLQRLSLIHLCKVWYMVS